MMTNTTCRGTEGTFSGLALWLVPKASLFCDAVRTQMSDLRAVNAGRCSGEFGIHATLVAGLGGRKIDVERLRHVTVDAVRRWREHGEGKEGLKVRLDDVTTRGSYFQVCLLPRLMVQLS